MFAAEDGNSQRRQLTVVKLGWQYSNMGTRAVERGSVGEAVAHNVRVVRDRRQLTQQQLAKKLGELGRSMQASTVAKIESGDRRVDVDDLAALAVALNVSPARLLIPDVEEDDDVRVVPAFAVPSWSAWGWATGRHSLSSATDDLRTVGVHERDLKFAEERPVWERAREGHPLSQSMRHVAWAVNRTLAVLPETASGRGSRKAAAQWLRTVQQSLEGVGRVANQLEDELSRRG